MARGADEIRIRPAREQDVEALVSIHFAAFPDGRGREARRRNFCENPRGGLDDLLVAEISGRIAGHGFCFRMETWIGGRPVGVGGVASVGVAPEARQTGVARALLVQMLGRLRARGTPLSMLYPFRHDFYRRLGWGLSGAQHRYRLRPQALPLHAERGRVRPGGVEDTSAIRRCYERFAVRGTGLIARGEPVWLALLAPEGVRTAVVPSDAAPGSLDGYIVYRLVAEGASHSVEMEVLEMVFLTDAASFALQGFLSAQRDQVSRVHLSVGRDEPLVALLSDPRGPTGEMVRGLLMVSAELTVGTMTRIVDLPGALRTRGYEAGGALALRIEDTVIPDNGQPVTLRVDGQQADVVPGRALGVPLLEADVAAFAQIYTGLVTPSQAVGLRLARVDPPTALPAVDGLLRTRPAHTLDVF